MAKKIVTESLVRIRLFVNRLILAIKYTTWDGRKWARWETDQNFCQDFPFAWKLACIVCTRKSIEG